MKKWEEDKNRLAHAKKMKGVKSFVNSNLKQTKNSKIKESKQSQSPVVTMNYFGQDILQSMIVTGTGTSEYAGKNLFGSINEVQGGAIYEDKDSIIDRSNSKLNSTKDSIHANFPLGGSVDRVNNLPIFKLLQAFKLQQYAKIFTDLGYGFEVYKVALLLPKQRHDLLNKLNLMPGHRARFLSLFEIIDQIYPKEEKFKMLQDFKKPGKSRSGTATNFMSGGDPDKANGENPASKKRRSLMKYYKSLDKQTKKDINDKFIKQIKERKPSAYQHNGNINIQNVISKHVSKAKTRKAIKEIFPPSMYDKYADSGSSNSRSNSKKKREFSGKREQKIQNTIRRNMLPPLPEVMAMKAGSKYVAKSKLPKTDMRRGSTGMAQSKYNSMSHKKLSRSGTRKKGALEVDAMSATKNSNFYPNPRPVKSGDRQRNLSHDHKNLNKKPKSLTREDEKIKKASAFKNNSKTKKKKSKSKSKSKSGSRKRNNASREGILSTSAASNAGRLISSASTSDKRSMKNHPVKPLAAHPNRLPKIQEKPVKINEGLSQKKPPVKGASKSTVNTAVKDKKDRNIKSDRTDVTKRQRINMSNTNSSHKNDSTEKEQSFDPKIANMSSIFTESGDKKIAKPQESILKSLKNKHNPYNDTSYPETSDEKPKISKELVVAGLDPQSNIDKCKYDRDDKNDSDQSMEVKKMNEEIQMIKKYYLSESPHNKEFNDSEKTILKDQIFESVLQVPVSDNEPNKVGVQYVVEEEEVLGVRDNENTKANGDNEDNHNNQQNEVDDNYEDDYEDENYEEDNEEDLDDYYQIYNQEKDTS